MNIDCNLVFGNINYNYTGKCTLINNKHKIDIYLSNYLKIFKIDIENEMGYIALVTKTLQHEYLHVSIRDIFLKIGIFIPSENVVRLMEDNFKDILNGVAT